MTLEDPEQERQRLVKLYAEMSDGELLQLGSEPWQLTDAARQLLRAAFERRGLDTAPLDAQPTSDSVEYRELEMIGRYRDLPEALLAKISLESAGIECFLADENIVRLDWLWSNLLGGIKLFVRAEDAGPAAEILQEPPLERFEVTGMGEYEHPRCPQCNSIDIHFEELTPIAFVSLYIGVPFPLCREGWKCHSCGHLWRADADANSD